MKHGNALQILRLLPLLFCLAGIAQADSTTQPAPAREETRRPDYPVRSADEPKSIDWIAEFRSRLKPLSRPRGERWPLIGWHNVPMTPQTPDVYRDELARGIVPTIRMDEKMIPIAKAIADAGGPVIMMQGQGGSYPFNKAGPPDVWAHLRGPDYKGRKARYACIGLSEGWRMAADEIRKTLTAYKAAGVTVNAVWMDWEGEPIGTETDIYWQAIQCSRCRATLPPGALANPVAYWEYSQRRARELLGTYLAMPVAEVFPGCSTTNWTQVVSTRDNPMLDWHSLLVPPMDMAGFTMSNPIAYGSPNFYRENHSKDSGGQLAKLMFGASTSNEPTREEVDQMYTHLLLRGPSVNQQNIDATSPWIRAAPWVCRWCPMDDDPSVPMMSRARYRETLRHLWLRGAVAMQVYMQTRKGYVAYAMLEYEDAQAVYDESLAWSDYILHGQCMNLQYPKIKDDGVLWSGMRLNSKAVVRTFKQGGGSTTVTLTPFPDHPDSKIELPADSKGATYFLKWADGKIESRREDF